MSLTTEQKINLLILAGFEPFTYEGYVQHIRLFRGGDCLMGRTDSFSWQYKRGWKCDERYRPIPYGDVSLDTCPDELIYEAIQS